MKNVTFNLGPTADGMTRQLTITRMHNASDGTTSPSAQHNADAGAVTQVTVALPDNQIWQAKLVDTLTTGEVSDPVVLFFNTGSLQFPGPRSGSQSQLYVLWMEDLSSSSSVSSSSASSSSASSVSSASSGDSSLSSSSVSSSSSSLSSSSSHSSSSASSVSSISSASSASSLSSSSASSSSSSQSA